MYSHATRFLNLYLYRSKKIIILFAEKKKQYHSLFYCDQQSEYSYFQIIVRCKLLEKRQFHFDFFSSELYPNSLPLNVRMLTPTIKNKY